MPPQWEREFGGENAAVDFIYIAALPRLVYASIVGIRMALVMMAELKLVHGTSRIMKSWLTKKQDEETREAVALGCRNRSENRCWWYGNQRSGVGNADGAEPKKWCGNRCGGMEPKKWFGTEVVGTRWWWGPKKWFGNRSSGLEPLVVGTEEVAC